MASHILSGVFSFALLALHAAVEIQIDGMSHLHAGPARGLSRSAGLNEPEPAEDASSARIMRRGGDASVPQLTSGVSALESGAEASSVRGGSGARLRTWRQALKDDPKIFAGCSSIFLDVGSNRGTHVRKLFEPQKYPGCPYLHVFDQGFGAPATRTRPFSESGLCAFGFEANPRWAATLQDVERAYTAQGWRVKWFAPEAVSNTTGTLPFYKNDGGADSDWAFSMRKLHANSQEVPVPEVDLSAFVQELHQNSPAGYRLMKMDIESAEFVVLPPFLSKQLLCKNVIDTITIEWHDRFLKSDASKSQAAELERQVNSPNKCSSGASTIVTPFDDESFRDDGMPLP